MTGTSSAKTQPPHIVSWDSTSALDGAHIVSATATDTIGQPASDSNNITVDNLDEMHVDSIIVKTVNIGQGNKRGRATVVVVDDLGGLVEDATVTGDFTGTFNEPSASGTTDVNGTAVIDTSGSQRGKVSVTFCVTSITHPTHDWSGIVCDSN